MKKRLAKLSAVVISVALVAILLSQIQIGDIITTLADIDPVYLIVGFVLYVCSYIFRALRFYILLNKEIRLRDLFNIVCVHNMANNILPARTGELSYIYLIKKLHNQKTGVGIATLFVARVFDFISICGLFIISAIMVTDLPERVSNMIGLITAFMILIVILLFLLIYFKERFLLSAKRVVKAIGIKRFKFVGSILNKGEETIESFDTVKSKRIVAYVGLVSVITWISVCTTNYFLIKSVGIDLSFWEMVIASSFMLLTSVLPIKGICGFGTSEALFTAVMAAFGVSVSLAIIAGFGLHIVLISYYLILGTLGLVKLKMNYTDIT